MARRLLLNGRMGLLDDDRPVVEPLAGGAVRRARTSLTSATASTTSAHCSAEWADYLEKPRYRLHHRGGHAEP